MGSLVGLDAELRPRMFAVAYRMLGSVGDAEDVVQDAFVRLHLAERDGLEIETPIAYATTVTTRLAIDTLRSARRRRETYVGTWLPEPVVEQTDGDPAWQLERDETVTIAFLVLMERLGPIQRAVFVLREACGYEYDQIGEVVDRTPEACRQIYSRASRKLADRPSYNASRHGHADLVSAFVTAMRDQDVQELERLLAEDVVFAADGGGQAPAIVAPLTGRVSVARFLVGLARQGQRIGVELSMASVNTGDGIRLVGPDGAIVGLLAIEIDSGQVQRLFNQINPDKLHHLGTPGDLNQLLAHPHETP